MVWGVPHIPLYQSHHSLTKKSRETKQLTIFMSDMLLERQEHQNAGHSFYSLRSKHDTVPFKQAPSLVLDGSTRSPVPRFCVGCLHLDCGQDLTQQLVKITELHSPEYWTLHIDELLIVRNWGVLDDEQWFATDFTGCAWCGENVDGPVFCLFVFLLGWSKLWASVQIDF